MPRSRESFASEQSVEQEDSDDESSSRARRARADASGTGRDEIHADVHRSSMDSSREMTPAMRTLADEDAAAAVAELRACLKHICVCSCNLSRFEGHQSILTTCVNMLDREKREIEETEARVTREDAEPRIARVAVHAISFGGEHDAKRGHEWVFVRDDGSGGSVPRRFLFDQRLSGSKRLFVDLSARRVGVYVHRVQIRGTVQNIQSNVGSRLQNG